MTYEEMGNKNGKTLMLLPGTCCDWQTNFANVITALSLKYHLICVNYDGFDGNDTVFTDFISVTEKIEKYIQDNFNGTIDAAIGSSLGASFVGQLIQRKNIHINHGIFGSPDLDQCNRVLASIEGALFIPLLNSFTGSETKRKKTIRKLMTEMSMTENSAKRFVECIEKFSKTSMKNEFYTDLITYLDDDINVDNTKVHFIYASKMGEKYKRRYKKHFHNPEIKEFNMNHEQWLFGTDEYRLPVLKAIDDFII